MKISILTPTYNRAKYLNNIYQSLKENKGNKLDFEWLIMDDGSEDNTEQVVKQFMNENEMEIKYFKQENQGKMSAMNNLMQYITGELVMCCDSDDYFTQDAFKIIENNSDKLLQNKQLYAIVFLKQDKNGIISGQEFKQNNFETTMFELYFKYDIQGEKTIVFNAKIRNQFKHELEANEKFITEARMYHKMDEKYKILCINKPIIVGDYKEDGYTKNINKTFKQAPVGYYNYFKEILSKDMNGVLLKKRLYAIKHFILFGYLIGHKFEISFIRGVFNKVLYSILYLPGRVKSRNFL